MGRRSAGNASSNWFVTACRRWSCMSLALWSGKCSSSRTRTDTAAQPLTFRTGDRLFPITLDIGPCTRVQTTTHPRWTPEASHEPDFLACRRQHRCNGRIAFCHGQPQRGPDRVRRGNRPAPVVQKDSTSSESSPCRRCRRAARRRRPESSRQRFRSSRAPPAAPRTDRHLTRFETLCQHSLVDSKGDVDNPVVVGWRDHVTGGRLAAGTATAMPSLTRSEAPRRSVCHRFHFLPQDFLAS